MESSAYEKQQLKQMYEKNTDNTTLVRTLPTLQYYVQTMDTEHSDNHAKASENKNGNAPSRPSPLTPYADIVRPINVVCPESELNTVLFSDVTQRSLLDGVLLDASILETLISGVPLREDSDSEVELEQLESDSDSEVAEWIVIDTDDDDDIDDDADDNGDDDDDNDEDADDDEADDEEDDDDDDDGVEARPVIVLIYDDDEDDDDDDDDDDNEDQM